MRPKTAKLMTSTQLRNLSAKTQKPNFEFITKPSVEVSYQKFIPRNFGMLCDQYNVQPYNIEAIMKAINKYNCKSLEDHNIMVQLKDQGCSIQSIITINQETPSIHHVIIVKLTPMILRKRKIKKEHNPLILNWNQIKKLLLVKDLTNYLIENMTYQNKKISLNVYSISGSEFIDEIQKPKDIEFVLEQGRFTCIMPKLIVYCDDINKNATIPLTNLKMSQLLQSNFQEIDNYMSEIDELSNFVIPQKKFPVSMQPGKLTKKKKKQLRKLCIMKNPYIKLHSYHHQSFYQTMLNKLANIISLQLIFNVQLVFVSKILFKTSLKTILKSSLYPLLGHLLKSTFLNSTMLQQASKGQYVQRMVFY